jgi:CHAD domain-containing protein
MQRTYRNARRCYRAACETHSDEHPHAWRRQVKCCAYQLEAIRPVGSKKMNKRPTMCTKLADLLGKAHDLATLHQHASAADLDAASALHFADMVGHERGEAAAQSAEAR